MELDQKTLQFIYCDIDMSCLQNLFSPRIPNKTALNFNLHAKLNTHTTTTPTLFCPSAVKIDGVLSNERDVRPPVTMFKPSIWGDIFSAFPFDDQVQQRNIEEIEALKKVVWSKLMAAKSSNLMILVDQLERLGLAYHFDTEIEDKLKNVYDSIEGEQDYDLFTTSLRFRLLRQHQYHVSCAEFTKFVDKDNKLKEPICRDIEGLLSLFEAAHVRIDGENILEDSVAFTRHLLSNLLLDLDSPMKEKVQLALDYPLHKSITVLNLRSHISIYENSDSCDEDLLRLAKFNFNYMQNIYRNELSEITTWWNKSDFSGVMHSRNRMVECYISALTSHFQPQYSWVRTMISKLYMMIIVMDDTYDNYATLEEIELLNRALERWNNMDDLLSGYLQKAYDFIMSVNEEFEREAKKHGKSFAIPYYIKAVKDASKAYGKEQQWVMKGEKMPKFEEYMSNSRLTTMLYVTFIATSIGIKSATKETIDWLLTDPKVLTSASDISRLLDDIGSDQRERKEGNMLTSIDFYMKEKGASKEEALSAFGELAEDNWKHLTAEWVKCSNQPKEMVVQFLNIPRLMEIFYKNKDDAFTNPERNLAPLVEALLMDHIPTFYSQS